MAWHGKKIRTFFLPQLTQSLHQADGLRGNPGTKFLDVKNPQAFEDFSPARLDRGTLQRQAAVWLHCNVSSGSVRLRRIKNMLGSVLLRIAFLHLSERRHTHE